MVLVREEQLATFVRRLEADRTLRGRIAGVLVVPGADPPAALSHAAAFPLAAFAPYAPAGYKWNPEGDGLNSVEIPVPVFLLDGDALEDAREAAAANSDQVGSYFPPWP
jgi:hypothetical protein